MALAPQHPRPPPPLLPLLAAVALLAAAAPPAGGRTSPISDLKSKISGVEELLEEFRKQLRQEQPFAAGDACAGDFDGVRERIIQTKASIEQGATFLLAPDGLSTWRECLHACCSQPHCTVAVVLEERRRQPGKGLNCYLFNCTYRGRHVCSFAEQQGFTSYSRASNATHGAGRLPAPPGGDQAADEEKTQDLDEPPRSDAGQDVVIQLPTDWAVLDGRDSVDDKGIDHYEWSLIKGDTAVSMKVSVGLSQQTKALVTVVWSCIVLGL